VQQAEGSDPELLEWARAGSAPAFAVLLHRHGSAVRAVVASDPDPTGAVVGTFVHAMRRLKDQPVGTDPGPWLLELAAKEVRDPRAPGDGSSPELDDDERDEIWAELDLRWPAGRVPRSVPRWVGPSALVLALGALAVLVPYGVLALGANGSDVPDELANIVARPYEEQIGPQPVDEELEENLEPPPFEFPDAQPEPDRAPAVDLTPPPAPDPTPEPDLGSEDT
jgi:hypothetical protein